MNTGSIETDTSVEEELQNDPSAVPCSDCGRYGTCQPGCPNLD